MSAAVSLGGEDIATLPMDVDMNGHNEDGTLKRKYEGPENGEHKDKKLHVEERKPSISDLHMDVGKIYQLCRTRKYPCFSILPQLVCGPCMNYG